MRAIDYIVLSCTNTPDWEQVEVEDLRRDARLDGKSGVGEHYIILRNGSIIPGRPLESPANVLHSINKNSIVIKLVGAADNFTESQEDALDDLVEDICFDLMYIPLIKELSDFDMWAHTTGLS
jgi:N-acetyl-anhydromuramyl-L-alanine amidase AmpD